MRMKKISGNNKETKRAKKAQFVHYERINKKAQRKIESLLNHDKNALAIFKQISAGHNTYVRATRKEDSYFDMSWIKNIEDTLPHLEKIIEHPKITTKTTTSVVPLELSKKINSESVQHLASHSQYVKSVDKDGNVIPERILNIFTEDEFVTYENRMIATLIRHLIIFIGKRYEYLSKNSELVNNETLYVKSISNVNNCKLEIETKIKFSRNTVDRDGNDIKSYLTRVEYMKNLVNTFNHTEFMSNFTKIRDVRSPLLRTNIIRKNPDYRACAQLFTFINSYNKIGINFTVHEDFKKMSSEEEKYLGSLNVLNFLSMNCDPSIEAINVKEKTYTPKVMTTADDGLFYFENYKDNPVFIRADDKYFEELEKLITPEVKAKPSKEELEVYKENYKKKKEIEAQKQALLLLKKRKEKAEKDRLKAEAHQDKVAAEAKRKAEEELKEAQRKAEEEMLAKVRENIVHEAKKDKEDYVPETPKVLKEEAKTPIATANQETNPTKKVELEENKVEEIKK